MTHPSDPSDSAPGPAPGSPSAPTPAPALLSLSDARGRLTLTATVLGSGIAFLDGTVVNVALPTIGRQLHTGITGLQWVVTGYGLTLASLILLGGSLGDRYGRRRIYEIGVGGFAVCSALCALAPSIQLLVTARVLQGIAAALLTPGSLAILQASFRPEDRMRAIGAWSGMIGIATAGGPILGGWLVGWTWRAIFWINVPLCVVVILLCHHVIPESRDPEAARHFDSLGVVLATVGLGGSTYALTEWGSNGGSTTTMLAAVVGVAALVGFVFVERRERMPLVPMTLFSNRDFAVVNLVTFVVYAALAGSFFFLAVQLQVSGGYSPLAAGAATVPVSILMLLLSERAGALASRLGARLMIGTGALVCALSVLLLARVGRHPDFLVDVLPGMVVFGLGLCALVAPLTGTVLAAAPDRYAGTASGINNAVSRAGGLLAVAALPLVIGLTGDEYADPAALTPAFRHAMYLCVGLLAVGGVAAFAGITRAAGRPSADVS